MKTILFLLPLLFICSSCSDFLEVGPNSSELDKEFVFKEDQTAIGALEALYHELQSNGFASGNASSFSFLGNLLSDDTEEHNVTHDRYDFYTNNIRPDNEVNYSVWSSAYNQIYNINALLGGIKDNDDLSEEVKIRIKSEAKFIRAFIYYYLVGFYGEVPLALSTDYSINQSLERSSIESIYAQINQDLEDALELLPEDYINADGEHIRPTQYAAYLLLARMALWGKDYQKAIDYADLIIDSGKYELTELDEVFLANSSEAIWQLVPVDPNIGASEGSVYILDNNPATPNAAATSSLTSNLLSIWENDDLRYPHWVNVYTEDQENYYYPFKYKIKSGGDTEEYSMVLRLAEVYLIRAEAYAMLGEVNKALVDLNKIRNRADLPDWTASDITDIQKSVLEERRRELFSEWGHRWLDLKHFGKLDEVLGGKKPDWSEKSKLLPIPEQDLLKNPFLTQNPGY